MIDPEDPGTVDIEQLTTPGRLRAPIGQLTVDDQVAAKVISIEFRLSIPAQDKTLCEPQCEERPDVRR